MSPIELPFGEAPMKPTEMDISMMRAQIYSGNMDDSLEWLEETIKERRLFKAREMTCELIYSQRMRLNDRIIPQLLRYQEVFFNSWTSNDEMYVSLCYSAGRRWPAGAKFRVKVSQIEKVYPLTVISG